MVRTLDPEVRSLLDSFEAKHAPPLESLPPELARKATTDALKEVAGESEPVARVENLQIPGLAGEIPIRIYTPEGGSPHPALLFFHGGGWVVCDIATHDTLCRAIARLSGGIVASVGYRLAPEHKFPAAVEDAYAATLWVAAHAESLGIDPCRIAVGGDSAGGNLAAVVALKCREDHGPVLALQILAYPVTNLASFDTPSYTEFTEGYHLTRREMEWFRAHYLAQPEDGSHPHASPLLAPDLRFLPPALIITAECDILRDEAEAYAERLKEAGVPVTCTRYSGAVHAFLSLQGALALGRRAIAQAASAVAGMAPVPAKHV